MYILGISAFFHDSAACLLYNGEIVAAAQEERFTRLKNDQGFPTQSIGFCLDQASLRLSDIDYIVFYEKPFIKFERLLETFFAFAPRGFVFYLKALPVWIKDKLFMKRIIIKELKKIDNNWQPEHKKLLFAEHHQSHAASAFFPSPYQEAVVLTMDGVGEWVTTAVNIGSEGKLRQVSHINFPHSIGLLYSAFTYYLGFKVNCDEYKVMGLAPFGEPRFKKKIFERLIDVKPDGSFRLNMHYFNYATGLTMINKNFATLFGSEVRKHDESLSGFHMDLAASIQSVTEDIVLKMTRALHENFPYDNLCLAGGVALNCVINGALIRKSPFKNIWIQPAAGDAGAAVGAAYVAYYDYLGNKHENQQGKDKMKNSLLGPEFNAKTIEQILSRLKIDYKKLEKKEFLYEIANLLAHGKIVGWFNGKMEFGPRALGNRSILADPRRADMQSILNQKIKFRESFRPFAPAILKEYCNDYFDLNVESPYMLLTCGLNKSQITDQVNYKSLYGFDRLKGIPSTIPAVTHVDFSSRVQTVDENNGEFRDLLLCFYELTGCPLLVNTSFNLMDEPIVCTPEDAIHCFYSSGIDILAFPNIIISKTANDAEPQKKIYEYVSTNS